jgi:hypothetical protein
MTTEKQETPTVEKSEKNTEVVIYLDRPRFVRFGHKALKKLGILTGRKMSQLDEDDFDMADLEKIMYCGLMSDAKEHNEDLKLEDMEDLLDSAESFGDIMEVMNKALEQAFQKTEKQKN